MTSSKSTKRALLTSVLALLMCVTMLVGATFAWFTDTASTGVNKIVSGNLKVDIIGANSDSHIEKLDFTKATGAEGENLLWEPGCRYLTEGFRIANNGNLALKWKAEINKDNITDGKVEGSTIAKDGKSLLDVIDFYVVTSTDENADAVAIENFTGNLAKGAKSGVYYIKGVMKTTAGNDYQDLTLDGITITVYATQDTVENDSFNNQYDKDAEYPAITVGTTLDDVFTGLTDKDGNGVDFGVNAPAKDVSVNGQGIATVTGFADAWVAGDVTIKGVKFLNGACFTAKENGTVGTLTLEDCTFYACDQSKIDLAPYAYNSLKNSGDGLCLNVDTKDSPNLKVVIKNCRFIGENDPTLNRDGWKDIGGTNWDPDTAVKNKSRGHAVMINGICGGGNNATAESVLIEGCTMDGIRGHAIQLYKLRMGVTVKDCTINSWGNNAQTAAGTKSDAAIRGDIVVGSGNLTVTNTRFGLNESTSLRHINVDNYSGNTNGSRVAGTY